MMHPEIAKLIEGFARFRHQHYVAQPELVKKLAREGQSPKALVVACCDSRVDPAIITDSAPGDLFIIRNVASLVPPCESGGHYHGTSAALEFGVCHLGVEHIIVLGHAQCGGIRALMEGFPEEAEDSFIASWMNLARKARNQVRAEMSGATRSEQETACEKQAILVSLENLLSFPWVRERVVHGTLTLHGWYFDLENGALLGYHRDKRRFEPLVGESAA